jgi:hypothetical protein
MFAIDTSSFPNVFLFNSISIHFPSRVSVCGCIICFVFGRLCLGSRGGLVGWRCPAHRGSGVRLLCRRGYKVQSFYFESLDERGEARSLPHFYLFIYLFSIQSMRCSLLAFLGPTSMADGSFPRASPFY